jgi:HTH-type transcriptional regulator, transcriptional repressor of NAD biosynthesis genes
VRRGFVLGKFMPPHAGHVALCTAAAAMVDELTILVCWLPDDPIPGPLRLAWMRELFPRARVVGHGEPAPQAPEEATDFWPVWTGIVRAAHPEPIDLVFAGEGYGAELARQMGGVFVPLNERGAAGDRLSALSGTAVRTDPWAYWNLLPAPVRSHYAATICLHGPESVGKSTLATRLAERFDTVAVPEYGRTHCEVHGLDIGEEDLLTIGRAQTAMIAAARPWCNRRLIADTDALMTAAWCAMLLDRAPDELLGQPKAHLYLLLDKDVPWQDDGTRFFGEDERRARFAALSEEMLERARVPWVRISGSWEERFERAVAAIEQLGPPGVGV